MCDEDFTFTPACQNLTFDLAVFSNELNKQLSHH